MNSQPPGCRTDSARATTSRLVSVIEVDEHVAQEDEVEHPDGRQAVVQIDLQELTLLRRARSTSSVSCCLPVPLRQKRCR